MAPRSSGPHMSVTVSHLAYCVSSSQKKRECCMCGDVPAVGRDMGRLGEAAG